MCTTARLLSAALLFGLSLFIGIFKFIRIFPAGKENFSYENVAFSSIVTVVVNACFSVVST